MTPADEVHPGERGRTISSAARAETVSDDLAGDRARPLTPAAPAGRSWHGRLRGPWNAAAWYAVFALYAGAVAAFSGPGLDRLWGNWAAGGYAVAAVSAFCFGRRGRQVALGAAVAGALVAPVVWLATQDPSTPDVTVVTRSAVLLLHHGSPYLLTAALASGGWLAYNPYLPVMALFGVPQALGLPGLAGDTRPWLAVATFALLLIAFRAVAPRTPGRPAPLAGPARRAAFATASPLLAFPLALGITDPPITALTVLAIALLTRPGVRAAAAAVVLGAACALKYTAWPALAVLASLTAARDGARAAIRLSGTAVATALALAIVLAPAAWASPAALIQNTVAYPLGLTAARSPAQSPMPGHILSTLGPAGHAAAITLLIVAGLALAGSLVFRPPATPASATRRLALGLTLLFALSPATRFGYLAYPLALLGWLALTGPAASADFLD